MTPKSKYTTLCVTIPLGSVPWWRLVPSYVPCCVELGRSRRAVQSARAPRRPVRLTRPEGAGAQNARSESWRVAPSAYSYRGSFQSVKTTVLAAESAVRSQYRSGCKSHVHGCFSARWSLPRSSSSRGYSWVFLPASRLMNWLWLVGGVESVVHNSPHHDAIGLQAKTTTSLLPVVRVDEQLHWRAKYYHPQSSTSSRALQVFNG